MGPARGRRDPVPKEKRADPKVGPLPSALTARRESATAGSRRDTPVLDHGQVPPVAQVETS